MFETMKVEGGRVYHTLTLPVRNKGGVSSQHIGIVSDHQSLLKLGHQIVQALDPSPQEQMLDALERIETLLKDRG